MFKGHVRKSVGSSPTACTREKDNIADDIPPQLRAPIKREFFYGKKEHANLSTSVCEEQTSINAVCDAMADAQTLGACSKECGFKSHRLHQSVGRNKKKTRIEQTLTAIFCFSPRAPFRPTCHASGHGFVEVGFANFHEQAKPLPHKNFAPNF